MSRILSLVTRRIERDILHRLLEGVDRDERVVYVTELVGCTLKPRLRRLAPMLAATVSFEPPVLIGSLVHAAVERIARSESSNVETEVEVSREVNGVLVKGRVDLLMRRDDGSIEEIVELKFTRRAPQQPKPHHVMQVRVYAEMLGCEDCRLYVAYLAPDRLAVYEVRRLNEPLLEPLVRDYLENTYAPRWDWECRYCPFRRICPKAPAEAKEREKGEG